MVECGPGPNRYASLQAQPADERIFGIISSKDNDYYKGVPERVLWALIIEVCAQAVMVHWQLAWLWHKINKACLMLQFNGDCSQ